MIESSLEVRVAELETEALAEPRNDRTAVVPEKRWDIASSEAISG
jgi:hypothetical protein